MHARCHSVLARQFQVKDQEIDHLAGDYIGDIPPARKRRDLNLIVAQIV